MTTIRRIIDILAIAAILLAMPSGCSDRLPDIPDYTVVGQPVTISLPISVPRLQKATRGELSNDQLNRVQTLWIRTYSALDGKATSDWLKVEEDYQLGVIEPESLHSVTLNTISGPSYIVGVANVDNPAVKKDTPGTKSTLRALLENADTWDDFLNIAVPSPSDQTQVNAPQATALPMAGCFSDLIVGGDHPEPTGLSYWQDADFKSYTIPASGEITKLKGAIHLRRLVSNITFRFISGDDNMELEVNSYQVMNAPKYSWLYERPTDPEKELEANFGDLATSAHDALKYYADVPQFGSQFIREETDDKGTWQTFDFWQAENKHKGTCTSYANRGKKTEINGVVLFTSLTGDKWTPNNEASYVMVDCSIDYGEHELMVNDKGKVEEEGGSPVKRSGQATYFIHLGAIGNVYSDFNSYRNVDYTYNVTVNGVDDIRVDAFATTDTGETYHNEEGLVVDLDAKAINLDCHYGVFNIRLEASELTENFGFIITTYDNGEQITINEGNPRDENGIYTDDGKLIDPKYYNWIELRPTTAENVLALYKPRFNADGTPSGENTFLLSDLYTKGGKLQIPDGSVSEEGYYTVFVNEYTYEPMFGEPYYGIETGEGDDGRPNWMHYVNQNPRRFYIKVSYHESPDGNSVYARSKYAVEQQSLMTYYSQIHLDPDGTAIGVERENETFGLNLRHAKGSGGHSSTNGRWNAAQYLSTGGVDDYGEKKENYADSEKPWDAVSVNRPYDHQKSAWATFLEMSEPLEVPGVTNANRLQGGPPIMNRMVDLEDPSKSNPHKLRKIRRCPTSSKETSQETSTNFTDPQGDSKYNIRAMSAFINRNRDNNGNGKIDAEELRWYIPAITRYIGMTLGENAMPQTLMKYSDVHQLPRVVNGNRFSFNQNEGNIDNLYYSRYMYIASNSQAENNVLWAMEGTSLSKYQEISDWTGVSMNPWQIRCIRNLGSDLSTVVENDKVTLPSRHNESKKKITMDYFNLAAIRTIQYTSNGTTNSGTSGIMPVHTINSPYNSVYAAFEYANEDILVPDESKPQSESNFSDKFTEYVNKNPCGNAGLSGTGWRVPNQIELTMMFNYHILTGWGAWLSCTVDYFDRADGTGSDAIANKLYMGATSGKTLLLSWYNYNNYAGKNIRVRCVRDVNP